EVAGRVGSWPTERRMGGSFDLIDLWDDDDEVVIVDAMQSDVEPGTVRSFDGVHGPLPFGVFTSTHSFGPAAVVELARSLGRLPRSLTVIGIEADELAMGRTMTPEVADAVDRVAKELQNA
ncbi:MAG: hydrogenase maturation protease, partial [Acidimicrobiia bacterium]